MKNLYVEKSVSLFVLYYGTIHLFSVSIEYFIEATQFLLRSGVAMVNILLTTFISSSFCERIRHTAE